MIPAGEERRSARSGSPSGAERAQSAHRAACQVVRAVRRLRAPRIALRSAASTSLHALPCDVQGSSAGHRTWRARLLAGARSRARSELGERARGTLGQRAGGRAGVGLTPDSRALRACPHGQALCYRPSRRHPVRRVGLERPETSSGSAAGSGQLGAAAALPLVSRGTSSRGGAPSIGLGIPTHRPFSFHRAGACSLCFLGVPRPAPALAGAGWSCGERLR